jgi:cell division septation protein DedD
MSEKSSSKKRYHIELTRLSIAIWSVFFLILLSWSFFLGILLGQGFMPGAATAISDLKGQINKIQEMVKAKDTSESRPITKPEPDPKLAFYERLASKKDEVKKENNIAAKPQPQKIVKPTIDQPPPPVKNEPKVVLTPKAEMRPSPVDIPYTVQVASLENEESAAAMTSQLIRKGYPAYYYTVTLSDKTLYRVRCGRFQSRQDADNYVQKLALEAGIKGFV